MCNVHNHAFVSCTAWIYSSLWHIIIKSTVNEHVDRDGGGKEGKAFYDTVTARKYRRKLLILFRWFDALCDTVNSTEIFILMRIPTNRLRNFASGNFWDRKNMSSQQKLNKYVLNKFSNVLIANTFNLLPFISLVNRHCRWPIAMYMNMQRLQNIFISASCSHGRLVATLHCNIHGNVQAAHVCI